MSEYDWMDGYPLPNAVLDEKKDKESDASSKQEITEKICIWHTWETYRGFLDVYQYCKSCGIKREGNL